MADNLILAEIQEAVKTAMRERNKEASTTLRMAISEFKKEEIDKKIEITDFLIVAILHKMIKQRKDAASQFTDANRQELADKEIREIDILSVYLPEQMKESDIVANIAQEIALLGASSMQDMGKVMGILSPQKLHEAHFI